MKKIILLAVLLVPYFAFTQDSTYKKPLFFNKKVERKGLVYIYWGYNREQYTNCDIAFKGGTYNFTLKDVQALDAPEAFDFAEYFGPTSFSIPQANFGFGYYLNNWFSISLNEDQYFMKPLRGHSKNT